MWIYDTNEHQAIHIEGISKSAVLDGFVYPLIAIRLSRSKNGHIHNEVSGGNVAKTEQSSVVTHAHGQREQKSA
jgi:hypothetical protein